MLHNPLSFLFVAIKMTGKLWLNLRGCQRNQCSRNPFRTTAQAFLIWDCQGCEQELASRASKLLLAQKEFSEWHDQMSLSLPPLSHIFNHAKMAMLVKLLPGVILNSALETLDQILYILRSLTAKGGWKSSQQNLPLTQLISHIMALCQPLSWGQILSKC